MAQVVRKWCYYDPNKPFQKGGFNQQMAGAIEQAYNQFLTTKQNNININGAIFDFCNMTCNNNGQILKLSFSGGCVPYKVTLGGNPQGLTPEAADYLKSLDPSKIGHTWLWWDNPPKGDPFTKYKAEGATQPFWTHYSPAEEDTLERLYQADPTSNIPQPINETYCAIFNYKYKNLYDMMIQGRNDDENKPYMPENQKRRCPVIRAVYCWFYDDNDGAGQPVWTPYELSISKILEEAYLDKNPEVDISIEEENCIVNFSQGIQYNVQDTSRRRKITRLGTEIIDVFNREIGRGVNQGTEFIPPYWEKGQTVIFKTCVVGDKEKSYISSSMDQFVPAVLEYPNNTRCLKLKNCLRLQNLDTYGKYVAKKQSIFAKNIPQLTSTQILTQCMGMVNSFDKSVNEFYMWYHIADTDGDVMFGKPLRKSIVIQSRFQSGQQCIFSSENIGYEDAMQTPSPDGDYILLLCRVTLGDCYFPGANQPTQGQYSQADMNTHPPVNPATGRPYDSVVFTSNDKNGKPFKRVAVYDIGQFYPEYVIQYTRSQ